MLGVATFRDQSCSHPKEAGMFRCEQNHPSEREGRPGRRLLVFRERRESPSVRPGSMDDSSSLRETAVSVCQRRERSGSEEEGRRARKHPRKAAIRRSIGPDSRTCRRKRHGAVMVFQELTEESDADVEKTRSLPKQSAHAKEHLVSAAEPARRPGQSRRSAASWTTPSGPQV